MKIAERWLFLCQSFLCGHAVLNICWKIWPFFSPPICPCRICQCKIWLQYEMLDNFLFKCFQCLFLMPISHHKAVKKGSLICVLCVQRVFSFIGQHKLPWEAENITENFLCVGLCFSPFWLGWVFFFFNMNAWGIRSGRARVPGGTRQALQEWCSSYRVSPQLRGLSSDQV